MRLFKVEAKNDETWVSEGAISEEFYVIAEDFVSALVKAEEVVADMAEGLRGKEKTSTFRIRSLHEVGEVVGGVVASSYRRGSWAEAALKKIQDRERGDEGEANVKG